MAPLEGITGYRYREAYHRFFRPAEKYFIPFITPKPGRGRQFSARELNDLLPEHNEGRCTVPQILTNKAEEFVQTAEHLAAYGYREINLNLGCPSRTVVSKHKGSGFLALPEALDRFLDEVFEALEGRGVRLSLKTRLGKEEPEEFGALLEIFNRYPLEELIVHPRTQRELYRGEPHWEWFAEAVRKSKNPLVYNGNLFTVQDIRSFSGAFPGTERVMLGRGLLANPGLIGEAEGGPGADTERIRAFHDFLFEEYRRSLSGERDVLFKMKELWCYLLPLFTGYERYQKKIRKAERLAAYTEAVERLFAEQRADSAGIVPGIGRQGEREKEYVREKREEQGA